MFSEIIMHDFTTPMRKRFESRKYCGPYRWKPSKPGTGRGFYMNKTMDEPGDSTFRLRIRLASDILPHKNETAFWADDEGFTTFAPIVARLPHGRGFLAGNTMGEGMASSLDSYIHEDEESAAYAAYSDAENAAEREHDYQERHNAEESE